MPRHLDGGYAGVPPDVGQAGEAAAQAGVVGAHGAEAPQLRLAPSLHGGGEAGLAVQAVLRGSGPAPVKQSDGANRGTPVGIIVNTASEMVNHHILSFSALTWP